MKYDCFSKPDSKTGGLIYTYKAYCDFCTSSEDLNKGLWTCSIPDLRELDFCYNCIERIVDRRFPLQKLCENSFLIKRNDIYYRVYPDVNGKYFIPGDYYLLISDPGWIVHICAAIINDDRNTIITSTKGCYHNAQECFKINPVHVYEL